jgi:hypothetical protein
MITTKQDGIRAAKQAISSYEGQVSGLRSERDKIRGDLEAVEQEQKDTYESLAKGLLVSVEPTDVAEVVDETGALQLRVCLQELEQKKTTSEERIKEIEADEEYTNREALTHPVTGDYSLKVKEAQESVGVFEDLLKNYDLKDFQWLYKKAYHKPKEVGVIMGFWRTITLANQREKRAEESVLKELNEASFVTCVEKYEQYQKQLKESQDELTKWQKRHQAVLDLVKERERLTSWLDNYTTECTNALRAELSKHLDECDYEQLHKTIRPGGRVLVAKCHALKKKVDYLNDLIRHVDKEILDRENRIRSIDRVQRKWRQKPYGYMRGDKTKWLETVPAMKNRSTQKQLNWIRTSHSNIYSYNRYGHYNLFMGAAVGFLAYDAFSYQAHERMPHEGFSRGVFGELDEYRHAHVQERADYSEFKEALNENPVENPSEVEWQEEFEDAEELGEETAEDMVDAEVSSEEEFEAAEALAEEEAEVGSEDFADES